MIGIPKLPSSNQNQPKFALRKYRTSSQISNFEITSIIRVTLITNQTIILQMFT